MRLDTVPDGVIPRLEMRLNELPRGKVWCISSKSFRQGIRTGDTVGIALDQDLACIRIYLNGEEVPSDVRSEYGKVKGLVYPAISVAEGGSIKANFANFKYPVLGYDRIIPAQDLV